jgi:NTP pyrophosphatase (non-canonical NTP hydrolase)
MIEDYQAFVNKMKVYPEQHKIVYPTLGMMGEAGEASEKVKKWLRGDRELDKQELIKELGDVLWYITALADDLDSSLEAVLLANVNKLSDRKERGVVHGDGDSR